jgi:hypothetical protein
MAVINGTVYITHSIRTLKDLEVGGNATITGTLGVTGTSVFTGTMSTTSILMGAGASLSATASLRGAIIPDVSTQTIRGLGITTGTTANYILICEHADTVFDFSHAQQTNPTIIIHSANQSTTEYRYILHNQTDSVDVIGKGSKVTEHKNPVELADDGSFDLPTASAGFGRLIVGDGEEWANFNWTSAAVVTLESNSANVVATDTDTKFCIFDNGTSVRIRNRLGAAKKVIFNYDYYTP